MKRIFGAKKEKAPAPTLDQATDKLNTRGDALDEKVRKLDQELLRHKEAIKKCRPGPAQEAAKRRALNVLKQKRLYESQREQLYGQQFNIEQTAFAVQSMQDSVTTVQAMQVAGKELKTVMKSSDLNIDNIYKMQDDMSDLMDMQQEIQDVMSTAYGVPVDVDEEELMGELDALEDELAAETETGGGVPAYLQDVDLPEVPHGQQAQAAGALEEDPLGLPAVPQRT